MPSHVLYLALGTYRVRAAREHVKRLAAAGTRVVLVVTDGAAWADAADEVARLAGVEVVRLTPDKDGSLLRAARTHVLSASGPLASAHLLIAGDAQALPTAWEASRRRPALEVRFEPYPRTPEESAVGSAEAAVGSAELAVLTPWYPSPNNPFAGAFVQTAAAAVSGRIGPVTVLHTEDWSGKAGTRLDDAIKIAADRFQRREGMASVLETAEGTLLRVPVPLVHRKEYSPWIATQETALRRALPGGSIQAPVIHAHAGIYGGVLAVRLARPGARIVVTEHASFLDKVFAQPAARAMYREVLERADAFLCVSTHLREQIAAEFPAHRHKLRVVPNVIDFGRFTLGARRSPSLLSWLYLGRLLPDKGVDELLEAFALVAAREPGATLTMVGSGAREGRLRARGVELGLGDRLRILPPVAPESVDALMQRHDLLVHASKFETFGMTVVEAVAAGLPVLATRSQGARETLTGIESAAGALMEVSKDPQVIVDAYWELRARAGDLDLPAARDALEKRYGAEAVSRQLLDAYRGTTAPETASTGSAPTDSTRSSSAGADEAGTAGRAVLLALSPAGPKPVADFAAHLLKRGVRVTLVTARKDVWQRVHLDPRVQVLSVEASEKRLGISRGERFLVFTVPRAVLRRARTFLGRRGGALGPELALVSLQRAHTRTADALHKRVYLRGYRAIRPRLLARIARREIVPALRLDSTDHVFVCDGISGRTGADWAGKHPHLTVTTGMDRDLYAPES